MGLLGNLLSGAVSDAIGKAVGEAAKKVVTPAAEHLAQKQAEVIDNVAKKAEAAVNEAAAAAEAAEANPQEGAAPAPSTEEQKQAIEALKGLSGMFSGAIAMAKKEAEAEEAAKKAREAAVFDNWQENLSAYPVWDVGGSEFELEELTPMNGQPAWRLGLKGRPYLVELYAAKLRAAGFVAKGCTNPLDLNADTYYKLVDGVCHAWNRTDACMDGYISVSFYADIYKPEQKRQQPAPADELKGLAKGLLKKLF